MEKYGVVVKHILNKDGTSVCGRNADSTQDKTACSTEECSQCRSLLKEKEDKKE